jgi:PAS domain S-box-containing protein
VKPKVCIVSQRFRAIMCILLILSALPSLGAIAQNSPPNVLILHTYRSKTAPYQTISSAFQTTLVRELGNPVEFYESPLDSDRFPDEKMQIALAEFLQEQFAERRIDLIVAIGAPAANFVVKYRDHSFPDTPVVFLGADSRLIDPNAVRKNATLISQNINPAGWIEDILQIAPDTTTIAMILGNSPLEKFWADVERRELKALNKGLSFMFLHGLSLDEIEKRVSSLPPHSFVHIGLLIRDGAGITYDGYEPIRRLHARANAPIYGLFRSNLGDGIVGGRLYEDLTVGVEGAKAAARILRGEPAESIPPRILQPSPPAYDWRELQRWGISEKRLPPGSSVLFHEPTAWQRYRWYIIGITLIALIETLLIAGLLTNFVRRRRMGQSLMESEKKYGRLYESMMDAFVSVDMSGRIQEFNPSYRKLLRYSEEELHLLTYVEITPEKWHELEAQIIREQVLQRGFSDVYEKEYRRKDGTVFPVELRTYLIKDQKGKPCGMWAIVRDIEQRYRAEMETQLLRKELTLFSRVATLGELTASIAHEINQPLAAILNNAQAALHIMQGDTPNLEELREIFRDIVSDDQRAADVIRSLRTMLKRDIGEHQQLPLNDLINDVMSLLRSDALMRKVSVVLDFGLSIPPIQGNRVQLQQVILNLIVNAFEALDSAGQPATLRICTREGDGEVLMDVVDSGPGIAPDRLDSIFEPFFTSKEEGLGLGLSLSRSIVTAHNGRLWAGNNPGGGATFRMALPAIKS